MTILSLMSVVVLALSAVGLVLPLVSTLDLSSQTLSVVGRALAGSGVVLGIALLGGVPAGVLVGIGAVEVGGVTGRIARTASDVLAAVPPIVLGFVVYAIVVLTLHAGSITAGAVALGCLIAPAVARATLELLQRVAPSLRDAATALGGSRARVVVLVMLRSVAPDLVRAVVRTTARAIGEAAPLLFVTAAVVSSGDVADASRVMALPAAVFSLASAPGIDGGARTHTFAMVLALVVATLGLIGRRRAEQPR